MSLQVYKASAGSGKTFALTQHYLQLLKHTHHKHILAVTFTNKATEEMKERMVQVLADIAAGKTTPNENRAAFTALQAAEKLAEVLHDYSHFNVSTIDGFYQQVMRSFVRELGLYGGYALMLDDREVIDQAIDDLILSLGLPEYQHLYQWLLQGAIESIDKEEDWQFRRKLTHLAQQLFKEDVSQSIGQLRMLPDAMQQVKNYKEKHSVTLQSILATINGAVSDILKICQSAGVQPSEHSKQKLNQLTTKVVRHKWPEFSDKFFDMESDWKKAFPKDFHKKHPDTIELLQRKGLPQALDHLFAVLRENEQLYYSLQAVLDKVNLLPMLLELDGFIQRYLRENNMVLLSQVNGFLRAVINDCDTPFIYEKSGTYLHHFMLDEFQDTSAMQWENFKPLIAESIANRHDNMVVGDVKQSIYRWRNSDWRILSSQLSQTFAVTDYTLNTNWRSDARIVAFNNACFAFLSDYLAQRIADFLPHTGQIDLAKALRDAYADVAQLVPDGKELEQGLVHIELYQEKLLSEQADEYLKGRILDVVRQLLQQGYQYADIAVLVNTGAEGSKVASWLLQEEIPILSADSLRLSQSPAIRLLVAVIRMSCSMQPEVDRFKFELLCRLEQDKQEALEKAMQLPLFEAVEQYIQLLQLNTETQNAVYLQAFQDTISDFVARNYSDARAFIQWWDSIGKDTKLSDNDKQNAVQIMTIHKSKGLAFPVVLMPYMQAAIWDTGNHENLLWCSPVGTPVDGLPMIPVRNRKELKKTCFVDSYYQEKGFKAIDYLNKWYVAFTRAQKAIYVFSYPPMQAPKDDISGYELLTKVCEEQSEKEGVRMQETELVRVFTYGELPQRKNTANTATSSVTTLPYYSHRYQDGNLKLRLQAEFSEQQRQGNILHQILQFMQTIDDTDRAIDKVERLGMLLPNQKAWAKAEIAKIMQHVQVRKWFDGSYPTVWNERTIVTQLSDGKHGALYRPDRLLVDGNSIVVVDYKFGEQRETYQKQISGYMQLLKQMGRWEHISGYLYYHKTATVVAVSI